MGWLWSSVVLYWQSFVNNKIPAAAHDQYDDDDDYCDDDDDNFYDYCNDDDDNFDDYCNDADDNDGDFCDDEVVGLGADNDWGNMGGEWMRDNEKRMSIMMKIAMSAMWKVYQQKSDHGEVGFDAQDVDDDDDDDVDADEGDVDVEDDVDDEDRDFGRNGESNINRYFFRM